MSQIPSRTSSAGSMMGSMSLISGGVADVLPRATNGRGNLGAPLRRSSRQQAMEAQMQARAEELVRNFGNLPPRVLNCLSVCACVLFSLALVVFVLWAQAMFAAAQFQDETCDQPGLKFYMFSSFMLACLSRAINQTVIRSMQAPLNLHRIVFLKMLISVPGWCLLSWGVYMVMVSRTCARTNAGLYYPTKYYIFAQVFCCVLFLTVSIILALGARYFILPLSALFEGAGCKEAVMKLPKVSGDAAELIDPDDGDVMSCPICMDSLASGKEVVRTPCNHHYHTDCLLKWCTNHLDCPMCRCPVGEADERV